MYKTKVRKAIALVLATIIISPNTVYAGMPPPTTPESTPYATGGRNQDIVATQQVACISDLTYTVRWSEYSDRFKAVSNK